MILMPLSRSNGLDRTPCIASPGILLLLLGDSCKHLKIIGYYLVSENAEWCYD